MTYNDIEAAFKAGFYAGAAEERKDGTPYPFRDWNVCFAEWLGKQPAKTLHESEDMELAVPRKLSTGEEIAARAGKEYSRDPRDLPNPPFGFQKPEYGSGSATQSVPRGSTKEEAEAREIPGIKSNESSIFYGITADAVQVRSEITGLGLAECRKAMEIDILIKNLERCRTAPEALHQGRAVDAIYESVKWLLNRARNGSQ